MKRYENKDRNEDFDYFLQNYHEFFQRYGHKFLAIQYKKILGSFDSVTEAIEFLSQNYQTGTYIVQECDGNDSAYQTNIMRLKIKG